MSIRQQLACALTLLVVAVSGGISAQNDNSIAYGAAITGAISSDAPLALYSFDGVAGDQVTVRLVSTTPGMNPAVSLLAPDQQPIAASDRDPFTPGSLDTRLSARLATTGTHSLLVTGAGGATGEFLLRLEARQLGVSVPLDASQPTRVNVPIGAPPQTFRFSAQSAAPTTLTVAAEGDSFPYLVELRAADGTLIGLLDGGSLTTGALSVPAGAEFYEVIVSSGNAEAQGIVVLSLGGAVSAEPTATPTPEIVLSPTPTVPAGCIISNNNTFDVNVREGPSTDFNIVNVFRFGTTANANARNVNGTWYRIELEGRQGWVAASVVSTEGPCGNLPIVQVQPAPATQAPTSPPLVATPDLGNLGQQQPQPNQGVRPTVDFRRGDPPTSTPVPDVPDDDDDEATPEDDDDEEAQEDDDDN